MAFPTPDRGSRARVRRVVLVSTTVLAALSLASCAGTSPTDGASAGDGELSGDVVFWHSFTQGPRAAYMERMADEFETANPDVNITIETFSWGEFQT